MFPIQKSPADQKKGKFWKIFGILLTSIVILFSFLVWYGFYLKNNEPNVSNNSQNNSMNLNKSVEKPTIGEADRQKSIFSNLFTKLLMYLFNDTGSSNFVQEVQNNVEKQFNPQTYFSGNLDLVPLAQQIAKSDNQALKQSLDSNPELAKETSSDGYSLLHFAILNNNESAIKILLDARADPNQIFSLTKKFPNGPDNSHTPLTYLIANYKSLGSYHPDDSKTLRIIDTLVKYGAKLNFPDYGYDNNHNLRQPPILYFRYSADSPLFKKIVEDGADINTPDNRGETLLYKIIFALPGSLKEIKLLLDLGADANHKSNDGTTPADLFCDWIITNKDTGFFIDDKNITREEYIKQITIIFKEKGAVLKCKI